MSQFDFEIFPFVDNGIDLSNKLNQWRQALESLHVGTTRPPYAQKGTMWMDDSEPTNTKLFVFDGSQDILVGAFDINTGESVNTGGTFIEENPPSAPVKAIWFESDSGKTFIRYKNPDGTTAWVESGGSGGGGVPKGIISMWSGSIATIPSGWYLCDGSNNTPDLRDRFIIGAGGLKVPTTVGGSDRVTLTTANMPSHAHGATASISGNVSGTTSGAGGHQHHIVWQGTGNDEFGTSQPYFSRRSDFGGSYYNSSLAGVPYAPDIGLTSGAGDHTHTFSGTISAGSVSIGAEGGGQAFGIMPPHYALAFIMKG